MSRSATTRNKSIICCCERAPCGSGVRSGAEIFGAGVSRGASWAHAPGEIHAVAARKAKKKREASPAVLIVLNFTQFKEAQFLCKSTRKDLRDSEQLALMRMEAAGYSL